jgi:hypothetical protein
MSIMHTDQQATILTFLAHVYVYLKKNTIGIAVLNHLEELLKINIYK